MFGRSRKSALDQARENGAQTADKAGETVKNFDVSKTAETAATVLADLKNKAGDTLDKAGVSEAVGSAATKAAGAVDAADLSGKAAMAGERTASTATTLRDWLAEVVTTLTSKGSEVSEQAPAVAEQAPAAAEETRSRVSMVLETVLGVLQKRAADAQEAASSAGAKAGEATDHGAGIRLDPETLANMGRVLIMIGTALSALFSGRAGVPIMAEVARGLRRGTQDAEASARERTDALASVGKDLVSTLADALIEAIQRMEERSKQAIDQGRDRAAELATAASQTIDEALQSTQDVVEQPADTEISVEVEEKKQGTHFFRWLLLGTLIGAGIAYFSGRNSDDGWEEPATSTTSYWPSGSGESAQSAADTPAAPAPESTPAMTEPAGGSTGGEGTTAS